VAQSLEFIFDFSSPYGYIGTLVADQIAAEFPELEVIWRPYLMGVAMKKTGLPAQVAVPIKGQYMAHDMKRTCDQMGVALIIPAQFPFMSVAVCRAFYALEASNGQEHAQHFARTAFERCFGRGEDITDMSVLASVGAEMGADVEAMSAAMQEQAVKDRLRAVTASVIERGCWGSPHFIVDGTEMFWGNDKRWELREYLRNA